MHRAKNNKSWFTKFIQNSNQIFQPHKKQKTVNRTIIREELNTFHEESTMRQLKNLHLDILSQFQLQQREMERMIGEYTSQMNQLVEENRQLRTALEKKNVFFWKSSMYEHLISPWMRNRFWSIILMQSTL